jgi:hypothetical protein
MHRVPQGGRLFQEGTSRLSPFGPVKIETAVCGSQARSARIVGLPEKWRKPRRVPEEFNPRLPAESRDVRAAGGHEPAKRATVW